MEESLMKVREEMPVLKFSDLVKLRNFHLKKLELHLEARIYSTCFKHRLLAQFEDISTYNHKEEVALAFNFDFGENFYRCLGRLRV